MGQVEQISSGQFIRVIVEIELSKNWSKIVQIWAVLGDFDDFLQKMLIFFLKTPCKSCRLLLQYRYLVTVLIFVGVARFLIVLF